MSEANADRPSASELSGDGVRGRSPRVGASTVLDPTSERVIAHRTLLERPTSLNGKRVGLLNITKPRGDIFLDRLEERLVASGALVKRYSKPTFTKPAPVDLRHEISTQCEVVIEALAD